MTEEVKAEAPKPVKPRVMSLQVRPTAGNNQFTVTIPPVNMEKSFLMITHWTFKNQAFSARLNDTGTAVEVVFDKPFQRSLFTDASITIVVVEMP